MYKWGLEAMNNGELEGRKIYGVASNGMKFEGYLDKSGAVDSFYPVLEFNL